MSNFTAEQIDLLKDIKNELTDQHLKIFKCTNKKGDVSFKVYLSFINKETNIYYKTAVRSIDRNKKDAITAANDLIDNSLNNLL